MLFSLLPFLFGALLAVPAHREFVVVVHPDVPVAHLTVAELQRVYTMEQTRWADGSHVELFDLRGQDDVRLAFYDALHRQPQDLKRAWMRLVLSGEGRSPTIVSSPDAMRKGIATTPGAIGYLPPGAVDASVKVVLRLPPR